MPVQRYKKIFNEGKKPLKEFGGSLFGGEEETDVMGDMASDESGSGDFITKAQMFLIKGIRRQGKNMIEAQMIVDDMYTLLNMALQSERKYNQMNKIHIYFQRFMSKLM